jgi:hypothetical protein
MKKALLLGLLMVFVLGSMSFAAVKYGVGGSMGTSSFYSQPTFVVNVDDSWDAVLGYKSLGTGDGEEAQTSLLVGATWYMMKNGVLSAGPSLYYYSEGRNTGGGQKAADYTVTHTIVGFTAKAALLPNVDLKADVVLYDSVGGQYAGGDVKGQNQVLSTFQLSAIFYIM